MHKNLLSIIICVFNEEKTIKQIIHKVEKVNLPENFFKEIIIIDNCSTDKTKEILENFKKKIILQLFFKIKIMEKEIQ